MQFVLVPLKENWENIKIEIMVLIFLRTRENVAQTVVRGPEVADRGSKEINFRFAITRT